MDTRKIAPDAECALDLPPEAGPVVVAMSGGVDSSVVAALLVRAGYQVIGVTLHLYGDSRASSSQSRTCCAGRDIRDAQAVARHLGIAHYVVDAQERFRSAVIDDLAETYLAGATPVPCIRCNQSVKFTDLVAEARKLGAVRLVTGHYVQKRRAERRVSLVRAVDAARDQSYFLSATTPEQLAYLDFPLGGLTKTRVRAIAAEMIPRVSDKPDSQDICFAPRGYADVIERLHPGASCSGDIMHIDGRVLGRHDGVMKYTVGQRRGLGVAVGEALFVVGLDAGAARVLVGPRRALLTWQLTMDETNWLGEDDMLSACAGKMRVSAQLRSTGPSHAGHLCVVDGAAGFAFDQPEEAVAPGQVCALYGDGGTVLGCGFIRRGYRVHEKHGVMESGQER